MNDQTSIFTAMEPQATQTTGTATPKAKAKPARKRRAISAHMTDTTTPPTQDVTHNVMLRPFDKLTAGEARHDIPAKPRTASLDELHSTLVSGLQKYFKTNDFKRAILGLSGGVDSALTLKIAVDALGPENITTLIMPELGLTKQENIDHAKILCDFMDVAYYYQPINSFMIDFKITPWKLSKLATANTKARMRGVLLYSVANTENALVLGTSNKSELLLGYGTKYGDLAADVEVIGDLFKTEVILLADHVGLPPEIVNKTPTAELTAGQTDEGEMGATYKEMDKVLANLDAGRDGCIEKGLNPEVVRLVFKRVEENKHKTQPPVVIKAR